MMYKYKIIGTLESGEIELEPVDDCPASECSGAECICGKLDNGDVVTRRMVSIDEVLKVFDSAMNEWDVALTQLSPFAYIRQAIEGMKGKE